MENSTCEGSSGSVCRENTDIFFERPENVTVNPSDLPIVTFNLIIFVLGVIGNTMVIVVWAGGKQNRCFTYTFLVSLAVADLLFLVIYLPLEILSYFVIIWEAGDTFCNLRAYIQILTGMASVFNLIAVGIERFLVIAYPLMATRFCKPNNCRIGLCIVWGLAICLALPVGFTKKVYPVTFHNNDTNITTYVCMGSIEHEHFQIDVYHLLAMFVVPAIFMTFCYICIIRKLWITTSKADDETRTNESETEEGIYSNSIQSIQGKKQVVNMLILVVVLFYVCWVPRLIYSLIIMSELYNFTVLYKLGKAAIHLSFVHSVINPIIYGFMLAHFRHIVFQRFKDGFCGKITCYKSIEAKNGNHLHKRTLSDSSVSSSLTDINRKPKLTNSTLMENSKNFSPI